MPEERRLRQGRRVAVTTSVLLLGLTACGSGGSTSSSAGNTSPLSEPVVETAR